jgi:sulfatase maturation enzyme AslB (radical SAM superfamily)
MLEELVAAGNTNCKIEFTSNMTTWNPKFYENLSKFDNVEIQMSIDGIEEVGEYIRYGTEWEKVKENVLKVAEMASVRPGWRLVCYTVLQALNYQYLTGIWEFLSGISFETAKPIDWWPITLTHPPYLTLSVVPLEERQNSLPRILEEAKRYEPGKQSFALGADAVQALTDSIQNMPYNEQMGKQFISYKNFLDSYRKSTNG